MKGFATILALAGVAAAASSTAELSPTGTTPASCATNYADKFEISVVNASTVSKRALQRRTALVLTLEDSVLHDAEGRIGYIASNNQFQFDFGGQAGAIYTAGWSVCSNGTLALGSSAIFYECLSGTFYNLYDESEGAQCSEIFIDIVDLDIAATASGTSAAATVAGVTQISDGQVQATTAVVSQISDGQIQATTATAAVVSQISDGQIQAATSTAAVVSQISDGQIQAATSTAAVVSQISDGQIQAATSTAAVVSQISDGQIQAATSSKVAVVSQISDGQIQATSAGVSSVISASSNGTGVATASPTTTAYTGAAALPNVASGVFGVAAGVLALAML